MYNCCYKNCCCAKNNNDNVEIILPKQIYALKGDNVEEELNIYYNNCLLNGSTNDYAVDINCPFGAQLVEEYRIRTKNYTGPTQGDFEFKLFNKNYELVRDHHSTFTLVDKNTNTDRKITYVAIGDSITRDGTYAKHIQEKLKNCQAVGTRQYADETFGREGRGGWTLENYLTEIGHNNNIVVPDKFGGDSPFLYPIGVPAEKFWGNVTFWQNVCYYNPTGYDFNGFQRISKGWTGVDWLYETNGYLKNPKVDDVMIDPQKPKGQEYQIYNGKEWVAMSPQPVGYEVSFAKYVQSNKNTIFAQGEPTHVSILLGANDFQTTEGLVNIDLFISRLKILIDSIHQYNKDVKVILCCPTIGANQDAWAAHFGSGATSLNYDRNVKMLAQTLIKDFDSESNRKNNIYVAPITQTLDPIYGFDYQEEKANIYATQLVKRYTNWVHPNDKVGQMQMGDALAAIIQYTR